jgi:hypothetical protein
MKLEQQLEALNTAQTLRVARANLMDRVRSGDLDPAEGIRNPDPCIRSMRVCAYLDEVPGIGDQKLRSLNLRAAREWPSVNLFASLGALTPRQREWLVAHVAPLRCRSRHGRRGKAAA